MPRQPFQRGEDGETRKLVKQIAIECPHFSDKRIAQRIESRTGVRISEQAVQYARRTEGLPASKIRKKMPPSVLRRCKSKRRKAATKGKPVKVLKLLTPQQRQQIEEAIADIACRRHFFTDEDIAFNVNKRFDAGLRGQDVAFIRRSLNIGGKTERERRYHLGLNVCPDRKR